MSFLNILRLLAIIITSVIASAPRTSEDIVNPAGASAGAAAIATSLLPRFPKNASDVAGRKENGQR